jgi:hypothetical protein
VPWEQLVNAMNDGQQTVPSDEALKTKYTNPGNKEILGARMNISGTTSCMRRFIKTNFQIKERSSRRTFR